MTTKTPTINSILNRIVPEGEIPEFDVDDLKFVLGATDEDLASLYAPEAKPEMTLHIDGRDLGFCMGARRTRKHLYVLAPQTASSQVYVLMAIPNGPDRDKAEEVVYRSSGSGWHALARTFPADYFGEVYLSYAVGMRALRECRDMSPGDAKLLEGIATQLQILGSAATSLGALLKLLAKVDPVGTKSKIDGLVTTIKQRGTHGQIREQRLSADSNGCGERASQALQHDPRPSRIDYTTTRPRA